MGAFSDAVKRLESGESYSKSLRASAAEKYSGSRGLGSNTKQNKVYYGDSPTKASFVNRLQSKKLKNIIPSFSGLRGSGTSKGLSGRGVNIGNFNWGDSASRIESGWRNARENASARLQEENYLRAARQGPSFFKGRNLPGMAREMYGIEED